MCQANCPYYEDVGQKTLKNLAHKEVNNLFYPLLVSQLQIHDTYSSKCNLLSRNQAMVVQFEVKW